MKMNTKMGVLVFDFKASFGFNSRRDEDGVTVTTLDRRRMKLSELGFHRSAKKCREKFENVYKYHRRTKEGRTSKSDKTYRFFDQLQALEASPRGAFPVAPAVKPPPIFMGMSNNPVPVTVPLQTIP
ncbi:hypothetical protein L6452_04487 [Arctium lappa]|uniref:Uncharacterized protein n=1 Tax=Arctium lappa TaxID=4217 RepID=A0ACB9EE37_ARCLA|nr:hypothetical protein L6452_04487 [Arctium lappa]